MTKINTGGPAFPHSFKIGIGETKPDGTIAATPFQFIFEGMSLRDYAAIEALAGMLAHATRYRPRDGRKDWHSAISEEAYQLADAMIAARDEVKP
jgi:hypothetical protein